MKVLLVFPAWPKLEGQTRFDLPPLGVLQVAACLPDDVEVSLCDENVGPLDLRADCDLVGISIMLSCQAPRAYEIAAAFREQGKPVVLGGLHVSLCPEEAASHADCVVLGEAEGLVEQLVADFRAGHMLPVYRQEGFPDIENLPLPRRELCNKQRDYTYKGWELVDLVETSRGCRFNCYPCCTPYLGGRVHRIKPAERVLLDIARCGERLFIVDNSLEQNVEYEKELFRRLADCGRAFVSHPITCEPEVLDLARKAGCWYVYHAIYTISDKIRDRIRMYHDHGIAVEGTVLLGMDEHTPDFIERLIDFLLTVDLDLAEFTVLTPFPHTRAREQMEREGRLLDRGWQSYDAGTVVFQPRQMSPDELQALYFKAWERFYAEETQTLRMTRLFLRLSDLPAGLARRTRSAARG
ncbi:MAG: B12-binding domain-containing radical SAM protein [Deltaproteobacteria bacterium]|nr:B12-binding domain-containing radical SAM protein [Deltaproteobacteria bacterium]